MVRFVLFFAVFACAPCTSFGALLQIATYTFNGSYNPSGVASGFSAPVGANVGVFSAASGGSSIITVATSSLAVNTSNYFRLNAFRNTDLEPFRIERVDFRVRATAGSGKLVLSTDVGNYSNFTKSVSVNSPTYSVLGIKLAQDAVNGFSPSNTPGTSLGLRLYTASDSTTTGFSAQIDEITVYGAIVPEPASMAVFGLLVGGTMIRMRRLRNGRQL
jgi:hypothetical protein